MLTSGGLTTDMDGTTCILVSNEQSTRERLITLWHEVIHLIRTAGSFSQEEEDVERYAILLADACPEALAWSGIPPYGNDLTTTANTPPQHHAEPQ